MPTTESGVAPPSPPKAPRFRAPAPQDVEAYARGIGYEIDGNRFCDHYAAKGWLVGKSPMKDWKAAVRTWRARDAPKGGNGHTGELEPEPDYQAMLDADPILGPMRAEMRRKGEL